MTQEETQKIQLKQEEIKICEEIFLQNIEKLNNSRIELKNKQDELISLKKKINELKIRIKKSECLLTKKTKKEFNLKYDKITKKMIPFLKKPIDKINLPYPLFDYFFSNNIDFVYQLFQERKKNLLKTEEFKSLYLIMLQKFLDELGVGLKLETCFSKNEIEKKLFSDENFKKEYKYEEYKSFIFLLSGGYSSLRKRVILFSKDKVI